MITLPVRKMVLYHIQMIQPISQWQHSAVTQDIRFRHQQRVHVKLIKHGVMRRQPAILMLSYHWTGKHY